METRFLTLAPASFNAAERTVQAVIATAAPVERRGPAPDGSGGDWAEVIDIAGSEWPDSVPLLLGHKNDISALVGTAEGITAHGDEVTATLRLAEVEAAADALLLIETGALQGVSVGYTVEVAELRADSAREYAVKVVLHEVSLVPVAADRNARLRAASKRVTKMDDENTVAVVPFRTQFAERSGPADNSDLVDALLARLGGTPSDAQRSGIWAGRRLTDVAREAAHRAGLNTRAMRDDEVFQGFRSEPRGWLQRDLLGAHSTSDFPALMGAASQRYLRQVYEAAQSPLKLLGRRVDRNDFRAGTSIAFSEFPQLLEVNEHGEIKHGTAHEAAASWGLKTYGRIFSVTLQALVNDDLGAIARSYGAWAAAAAAVEADRLFALISGTGATISETGLALWHATHANYDGSGAALGVATLATAIAALRNQRGLNGGSYLNLRPAYLLVGPSKELVAEQIVAQNLAPAAPDDAVPDAIRKLQVLVEPRIGDSSWYLFAAPGPFSVLEYGSLASAPGVQLSTRDGFNILGTEFRAVVHFGAGAVDYRGGYKNVGA